MSVTKEKIFASSKTEGSTKTENDFPWNSNIQKYSINLMWINKKLIKNQPYIDDSITPIELNANILEPALKWAKANPDATVNLWYDSVHTEQEAIKRTQDVLSTLNIQEFYGVIVHLRDIREIPIVVDNPDAFSSYIPVYFRVDLLKAIIVVDAIEREGYDSAIFSDIEVGNWRPNKDRMNEEELFSPVIKDTQNTEETDQLEVIQDRQAPHRFANAGLILNNDSGKIENQFIQLYNNPAMILAIKHAVINVNLSRAISALNFKHEKKWLEEDYIQCLARTVFSSIQQDVFAYYEAITSPEYQLTVRPDIVGKGTSDDTWIPYNPDEHGYAPFGLHCFDRCGIVIFAKNDVCILPWTVFTLPKLSFMEAVGRNVDVRPGSDHYKMPWALSESDKTPVPATSNDGIYRCQLMESTTLAYRMLMLNECASILRHKKALPIIDLENIVLEYFSDRHTIAAWRKQQQELNQASGSKASASSAVMSAKDSKNDFKTAEPKSPLRFSTGSHSAALTVTTARNAGIVAIATATASAGTATPATNAAASSAANVATTTSANATINAAATVNKPMARFT